MKFMHVIGIDNREMFLNPMCITHINTSLKMDDGYYYSVMHIVGGGKHLLFHSDKKFEADDFTQNFVLMVEEALTQV